MTGKRDNDTSTQSQSERDRTVAGNEGSSAELLGGEIPMRLMQSRKMCSHKLRVQKVLYIKKEVIVQVEVKRGELYYANLYPVIGSEQGGIRPVIILQNDIGNRYSPTTIVAALTSKLDKAKLPTHVMIRKGIIEKDSIIMLEQIRTIDKSCLIRCIGAFDEQEMMSIDNALIISLGISKKAQP